MLRDAFKDWHGFLNYRMIDSWPPEDGEWANPPGFPIPTKSKEEILRISLEDGAFWNDWVCVGPIWGSSYVSHAW